MSYIGNQPTSVAFLTDTFNGNGSTTVFTMSVAPATTSSMLVAITGVVQDPSTYSIVGTTLTFSAAPPSGTGNISVRYLGIPASGVTTTAYRTVTEFTATAGQTTFSVPSYTVGYIDVYRNGVMLGSADYTATNGTTVVLAAGATAGDLVETISFYVSSVLNALPQSGGTLSGSLVVNGDVTGKTLIVNGNGTYSAGSIYSDTNWGMIFRAKQSSPVFADFMWANSADVERMRINSSGNVLIGTTTQSTGALLTVNGSIKGVVTSGTAVTAATGSPTLIDFTSIPSWVKRITVMLNGVSINTANHLLLQLGTSGGVVNSGYVSTSTAASSTVTTITSTAGFISYISGAASSVGGNIVFNNLSGNTWTVSGTTTGGTFTIFNAGYVTLGAAATFVRITTDVGTAVFDAGTINILYEG